MKILITAGPTREYIDPVRFISNPSTGKMGFAVAYAAKERECEVRIISGPVCILPPDGAELIETVSAADMFSAVSENIEWCDVLVMTAAVADWRPATVSDVKIKKQNMNPSLQLERTVDILKAIKDGKRKNQLFVGFAAETGDVESEARRKLIEKGLDMIVANDIRRNDSGFGVDTNKVSMIDAEGLKTYPVLSKHDVADEILNWVERAAKRI